MGKSSQLYPDGSELQLRTIPPFQHMSIEKPRLSRHSPHPLQVTLLAAPKSSPLSLFGPVEVFAEANRFCSPQSPAYEVEIVATDKESSTALLSAMLGTSRCYSDCSTEIDTLLVVGGLDGDAEPGWGDLLSWLRAACSRARRFGAVCSGSVLLAKAGLLSRRQITTHWSLAEQMSQSFPEVQVVPDRLFMRDENCYTSAGAASAIDLALALVTEDLGEQLAHEIAKRMVVFLRRSGSGPQLSATMKAQTRANPAISDLLVWMADNLDQDLSVPKLAQRTAMSPRNFARHFVRETQRTPARHVTDLRLEAAIEHLSNRSLALKEVADASGFKSPEVLRRIFVKAYGISPVRYRETLECVRPSITGCSKNTAGT